MIKQTLYLVAHCDYPLEDFAQAIVDPDLNSPQAFLDLEKAQAVLEEYLEQGLEYYIATLEINIK